MSETFYVKVTSNKKYSMEGKIIWAESGKEKSFSKTIEMLGLMETALDTEGRMAFKTWNTK